MGGFVGEHVGQPGGVIGHGGGDVDGVSNQAGGGDDTFLHQVDLLPDGAAPDQFPVSGPCPAVLAEPAIEPQVAY